MGYFALFSFARAEFSASTSQTNITANQELEVSIALSLQGQGNKIYHLEGALKKEGTANYFGLTWNDSEWVKYTAGNNFSSLKKITTDQFGKWQGIVKVKIDQESSLFSGNGIYILRFKRFTSTGSSSYWSDNSINLTIYSSSPTTQSSPPPSPTPSLSPSSSPNPSSSTTFTISQIPPTIDSTQSFAVTANITNFSPNSRYYLKGAFLKTGSSNYFGKTKVGGSWMKNSQSYSNQIPITTDPSGNFSGQIEAMADPDDSGFTGAGEYLFKVARYTQEGSGPIWSNQVTINITHSEETSISSSTTTPSETVNSTSQSTTSQNSPQTTPKLPKNSSKPPQTYTLPKSITASSSSLAGVSVNHSTSQNSKYSPKTFFNPATLMAVSLIIMGGGLIAYYFTKR